MLLLLLLLLIVTLLLLPLVITTAATATSAATAAPYTHKIPPLCSVFVVIIAHIAATVQPKTVITLPLSVK
jgi:hypothetical protein